MAVACLNNRAACYLQLKSYLEVVGDASEVPGGLDVSTAVSCSFHFLATREHGTALSACCDKVIRAQPANFKAIHRRMAALDAPSPSSLCALPGACIQCEMGHESGPWP